ncbi:MAG: SLOG family protein, partial [Christensenella sp.]
MEKSKTCCFTGHRKLPQDKIEQILIRLNQEVDNLISQGVTDFISGGAIGFDQIAASLIVAKKEMGNDIRLIFALPCRNQDMLWSTEQKRLYRGLLDEADEIIYVSEEYTNDCMKKRNQYMVDRSTYCICTLIYETGGTAQTVRYAG